jgi:hypothetical protein
MGRGPISTYPGLRGIIFTARTGGIQDFFFAGFMFLGYFSNQGIVVVVFILLYYSIIKLKEKVRLC